jgi:hypothetical protein
VWLQPKKDVKCSKHARNASTGKQNAKPSVRKVEPRTPGLNTRALVLQLE